MIKKAEESKMRRKVERQAAVEATKQAKREKGFGELPILLFCHVLLYVIILVTQVNVEIRTL